jgi:hypothetical protein
MSTILQLTGKACGALLIISCICAANESLESLPKQPLFGQFDEADAVVPESEEDGIDDVLFQDRPVEPEMHIRRTDICAEGNECVYKFTVHTAGHSADDDGSNEQLERHMSHLEYSAKVSPMANTKDNIKAWDVRGMELSQGGHGTGQETQQHGHEFSQCSLQLFQDSATGKVHAKVHPHDHEQSGCPSWAMQLLSESVPSLVPVASHAHNKKRFSHQENVSTPTNLDERKVDVRVHSQGPKTHQVLATVHHHYFNQQAYKNVGMLQKPIPQMKSDSLAQVVDNVITRHRVTSRVAQFNHGQVTASATVGSIGGEMPDLHGGKLAEEAQTKQTALHVSVDVEKLWTNPVGSSMIQSEADMVTLLAQAKAQGHHVRQLHDQQGHRDHKKKHNPYAKLKPNELLAKIQHLADHVDENTIQRMRSKASLLMETEHGPELAYNLLKQRHIRNPKGSAVLIGAISRLRPLRTEMLLEFAHDDDMSWMVKHQVTMRESASLLLTCLPGTGESDPSGLSGPGPSLHCH